MPPFPRPDARPFRFALIVATGMITSSCGWHSAAKPVADEEGYLLTAEQVRRTGANNAWDVLRRSGAPLSIAEDRNGNPGRVRKRGNSSINLSNTPLLVVDEVQMADITYLREIPAASIHSIRIFSGTQGTIRYGTGSGNGVIVVTTRVPQTTPRSLVTH